jgi:eukaryotic-like serine/threonine-protein kinase
MLRTPPSQSVPEHDALAGPVESGATMRSLPLGATTPLVTAPPDDVMVYCPAPIAPVLVKLKLQAVPLTAELTETEKLAPTTLPKLSCVVVREAPLPLSMALGPKVVPPTVSSSAGPVMAVAPASLPEPLPVVGKQAAQKNGAASSVARTRLRRMDRNVTRWRSDGGALTIRRVDRVGGVLVETYRIERLIAEGSMGSVYEARHLRIPKRFAVKFLRLGLEDNREALQRFRREAEVVATLEHPNVVGLYDYNVAEDGVPYIVLEYLDGEPLSARLERQHKLPLAEAAVIIVAVGRALEAAHARDVVHRDLKPENIMLLAGGGVKVVDFGVAKLRGAPELTAVNTVVGTVPYMSPEQLMGNTSDPRVDQYALATIAYELLAGEMAFDGTGAVADVARRVLMHTPPFIAGIPQALNEVVFRGMSRDPRQRFPSVTELVAAFTAAAAETVALPELQGAEEPLPPLAGEATRITTAQAQPSEDELDPPAPPPEPRAPNAPRAPAAPQAPEPASNGQALGGATLEMAAVNPPEDATGETTSEQPTLPSLKTMLVAKPPHPQPVPSDARPTPQSLPAEPRVTLKSMSAAAAPWDSVAVDVTKRSLAAGMRARWILTGALIGLVVALALAFLLMK